MPSGSVICRKKLDEERGNDFFVRMSYVQGSEKERGR